MIALLAACTPPPVPTPEAVACSAPPPVDTCGGLDCDGVPDLVLAQTEDAEGAYVTTSTIVWNGDPSNTTTLPTIGAADVAAADLDQDGWPDLVFADLSDGDVRTVDSLVYYGGPDGFGEAVGLPTVGASDVNVVDLDQDGWLDLVFANRYDGGSAASEESYLVDVGVYLGGPDGCSVDRRLDVPGFGAAQTAVADFDGDGWNDLAIASGTFHATASWVYYGGDDGFSADRRVELPTSAPEGVLAEDLDDDGWIDLVFANFYDAAELEIDSFVFWGSADGFEFVTGVPTSGATDAVAVDLDGDHCRELVFANSMEGGFFDLDFTADSAVWRFGKGVREPQLVQSLPTVSAAAVAAGDLDGDGMIELAFANRYDEAGGSGAVSWVYEDGERVLEVPAVGAAGITIVE